MFLECHVSCTVNISFPDFEKRVDALNPLQKMFCSSLPSSPYFLGGSKMSLTHRLTHLYIYIVFLNIIKLILVLNIAEILLVGR